MTKLVDIKTLPAFAVIIRCTWCRGKAQREALSELKRRGLWLSPDQKQQAGLTIRLAQVKEMFVRSWRRDGEHDDGHEFAVLDMTGTTLYQNPWRGNCERFVNGEIDPADFDFDPAPRYDPCQF